MKLESKAEKLQFFAFFSPLLRLMRLWLRRRIDLLRLVEEDEKEKKPDSWSVREAF